MLGQLDFDQIQAVSNWMRRNLQHTERDSYYSGTELKNKIKQDTCVYLTTDELKTAMAAVGFLPVNPEGAKHVYRVQLAGDYNINPFIVWAGEHKFSLPQNMQRFVIQAEWDTDFPAFADYEIIKRYLDRFTEGNGAVDAFVELWKVYKGED